MKRSKLTSSTLSSAGYDVDDEILELEFTSGQVYHYFDVPEHLFTGLMKAVSPGEYFNQYIKDEYDFIRL